MKLIEKKEVIKYLNKLLDGYKNPFDNCFDKAEVNDEDKNNYYVNLFELYKGVKLLKNDNDEINTVLINTELNTKKQVSKFISRNKEIDDDMTFIRKIQRWTNIDGNNLQDISFKNTGYLYLTLANDKLYNFLNEYHNKCISKGLPTVYYFHDADSLVKNVVIATNNEIMNEQLEIISDVTNSYDVNYIKSNSKTLLTRKINDLVSYNNDDLIIQEENYLSKAEEINNIIYNNTYSSIYYHKDKMMTLNSKEYDIMTIFVAQIVYLFTEKMKQDHKKYPHQFFNKYRIYYSTENVKKYNRELGKALTGILENLKDYNDFYNMNINVLNSYILVNKDMLDGALRLMIPKMAKFDSEYLNNIVKDIETLDDVNKGQKVKKLSNK